MIEIKNKFLNANKIVSLEYIESKKNNKNYLVILLDTVAAENKMFIEVFDKNDFNTLIENITQQLKK